MMTATMASSGTAGMAIPSAMRRNEPLPEPTFESLVEVLFQATSTHHEAMSRAADYLSDLETHVILWSLLIDVAFTRACPFDVSVLSKERSNTGSISDAQTFSEQDLQSRWRAIRTVAIIRFKNGVDKYWRSRVVNRVTITIPKDAKDRLRHTLLRCLDEEDRGVALQASVAISRMARYDFPNAWPTLFDDLQRAMVEAHSKIVANTDVVLNRLILMRAADVCARTLKELGTVRILAGRIRMTDLSQQLLPTFVPMFQQYYHETLPYIAGAEQDQALARQQEPSQQAMLAQRIRTCHLLLKCVTHLAVADAGTITRNPVAEGGARINYAREMFRVTPSLLQGLFDVRWSYIEQVKSGRIRPDEGVLVALQKHLLAFGKLYIALADREKSKAPLWEGWDEVVLWYWQRAVDVAVEDLAGTSKASDHGKQDASVFQRQPTKMIVQAIALLQRSLQEWNKSGSLPESFKSEALVSSIVDVLVGKLMLLTRGELEMWQEDSEDWSVAEEAETYSIDVRPAAERALLVLSGTAPSRQSTYVAQLLWQRFDNVRNSTDTSLDAVLRRDAIYAALGRCCDRLNNEDEVLTKAVAEHFVPCASLAFTSDQNWVIIRRRIAWLIWEWSEQIDVQHRFMVYELLVSLLEEIPGKTDVAVRLASARSLAALADAIEFDSDAFRPFIDASLSRLANLAAGGDLHEMDSIKTCTNAMSILIERLGARVSQHLEQLARLVPHLWTLDDPECKARPSIIVFVGRLVRSVELIPRSSQGAGNALHGIVSVIVRDSLAPHNSPLLGKDALELWIRTLRSSSQMTDPLFTLLDLLPVLLDQPDFCPEACRIAQESTLMAAKEVVDKFGFSLFESFAKIVGDPQSPLVLHPITALDIVVQALHAQGVDAMSWASLLDATNLFSMLLGSLLKVKDSNSVTGYFVALLARLAFVLNGNTIFLDLVRSAAPKIEGAQCDVGSVVLRPMAEMWCARVETMASSRKRKITCLGLASLLASADAQREPQIFDAMQAMIGVWMDLMGDVREDIGGAGEEANAPSLPNAPPSSPQLQRSRSLSQASEVMRHRSPSPALEIPGLEGIDDADEWLQETSPGKARLTELNRLDPVNTVKLTTFISDSLRHAQMRGGPIFAARWNAVDPLVLELLQKDLSM